MSMQTTTDNASGEPMVDTTLAAQNASHGAPVQAWPSGIEPGSPEIASAIEAQLAAN